MDDTWLVTIVPHRGPCSLMTCSFMSVCVAVAGHSCLPTRKCLVTSCVAFLVLGVVTTAIAVGITFGILTKPAGMCHHTCVFTLHMFPKWVNLWVGSGWHVLCASHQPFAHPLSILNSCKVPVVTAVMTEAGGEETTCPGSCRSEVNKPAF